MQWAIFSSLFSFVGPPIIGSVDAIVAALQGWMRPILIGAVPLSIAGKMIWHAVRGNHINPMGDLLADAIAGSILVYMATELAGLGPQGRNLLLTGLSNELGQAALGGMGGATVINAAAFDEAWNRSFAAGLDTYSRLPWSGGGIVLMILVAVYWIFAIFAIGVAFMIWTTSFVLVALLVSFWPVGVGLFAFEWTRGIAWGWLRATLSNILLQVMSVMLMSIAVTALARALVNLRTLAGNTGNEITRAQTLLGAALIVGFLAWLSKQLPGLAATIAHGFTGFGQIPRIPAFGGGGGGGNGGGGGGGGGGQNFAGHGPSLGADGSTSSTPSPVPRSTPPGRALG